MGNILMDESQLQYKNEVKRAMDFLAQKENTFFLGQSVAYPGNAIYKTLADIPAEKKLELPVFEEVQMGMSIGMALEGFVPVSVFPRFNFLLLAMNQLVNHLDKIPIITKGNWRPKVIIKTMIGSVRPLHPGVQHCGDFTEAFQKLGMQNVDIMRLDEPDKIFSAYAHAYNRTDGKSTILIEHGDFYSEK